MKRIWPPGRRQGVPENQQKYVQIDISCVRRFPQKTEGSTAERLPMFFEQKKNDKTLYKTEHNETQQK